MRRALILAVAALAVSFAAEARAQGYGGLMGPSRVGTTRIFRGYVGRTLAPQRRAYYSNSLYSPGYSYTQGYGPFGNFSQNTLYGNGYSYTSGYGVPSYGPGYGFAPFGGYGYRGGGY